MNEWQEGDMLYCSKRLRDNDAAAAKLLISAKYIYVLQNCRTAYVTYAIAVVTSSATYNMTC